MQTNTACDTSHAHATFAASKGPLKNKQQGNPKKPVMTQVEVAGNIPEGPFRTSHVCAPLAEKTFVTCTMFM